MNSEWLPEETSTHQDHVIAHVIGATVLGHFVLDETLHLLLDMGFIWSVYLDGQMVLLPQSVALGELEITAEARSQLGCDLELLERDGREAQGLARISPAPDDCLISEVSVFASGERRRLVLQGETSNMLIEMSLATRDIEVSFVN